jgi:hypothetical protein
VRALLQETQTSQPNVTVAQRIAADVINAAGGAFAGACEGHAYPAAVKSSYNGSCAAFRCAVQESWWSSVATAASMGRRRAQKKKQQENSLVQHRAPSLNDLLERAKEGNSALAVKAYLDAGGSPVSRLQRGDQHMALLHYIAFCSTHPHNELAESVRLLVAAGANINVITATEPDGYTALMFAVSRECCTTPLQAFLQNGANALVRSTKCSETALLGQGVQTAVNCC